MDFIITSNVFNGPLDLLLHLVQKKKLDVTAVAIAEIADDYLDYMKRMEVIDIEQITSFLEVATILLKTKLRALFPNREEEELEEDTTDLLLKLMNKKYYSVLADMMTQWEESDIRYFKRGEIDNAVMFDLNPVDYLDDVTLLNLAVTFEQILSEFNKTEDSMVIESVNLTIAQQVQWIIDLCQEQTWHLRDMFAQLPNKFAVVVSFLALLECMKDQRVLVLFESKEACLIMLRKSDQ